MNFSFAEFCLYVHTLNSFNTGGKGKGILIILRINYLFVLLRFGLANAINDYQRLKIHVVCREFLIFNAY